MTPYVQSTARMMRRVASFMARPAMVACSYRRPAAKSATTSSTGRSSFRRWRPEAQRFSRAPKQDKMELRAALAELK
jgi:hypothetical protein